MVNTIQAFQKWRWDVGPQCGCNKMCFENLPQTPEYSFGIQSTYRYSPDVLNKQFSFLVSILLLNLTM